MDITLSEKVVGRLEVILCKTEDKVNLQKGENMKYSIEPIYTVFSHTYIYINASLWHILIVSNTTTVYGGIVK